MPVKQKTPEQQQLDDLRFRIRHSAAHIMAEAVLDLFPEAKFAVGPPTADGFYYDFSVERPFAPRRPRTHRGADARGGRYGTRNST